MIKDEHMKTHVYKEHLIFDFRPDALLLSSGSAGSLDWNLIKVFVKL